MSLDPAKVELARRCNEERVRSNLLRLKLPFELDVLSAITLIGNLQLALRHPANTGPNTRIVRFFIDETIRRMREAGLTAHAELARLGDDPGYDS